MKTYSGGPSRSKKRYFSAITTKLLSGYGLKGKTMTQEISPPPVRVAGVCQYHEQRSIDMSGTREKVEKISGKLTVLMWMLGIGLPAILASHLYIYSTMNKMEITTVGYINRHMQEAEDGFRRLESMEEQIRQLDKRLDEVEHHK